MPPFHAAQFFPLTRKSMGGIAVDRRSRVVDDAGRPVPGLFAAGEAAGLAGSMAERLLREHSSGLRCSQDESSARSILADMRHASRHSEASTSIPTAHQSAVQTTDCIQCHNIGGLASAARPGYWHFERAHAIVLEQHLQCAICHAEMRATYGRDITR